MVQGSLKFDSKTQDIIACILFLSFVPILAHFSFSWMGFCPTDDGLNLAFSRRLLEGQVPHRDFINIRPIGSALLHLPFVLFGGDYTFWISRFFVWFQFACISWVWTTVIVKSSEISLPVIQKCMLAAIAFMLSTHVYPIMAWYTTDGLFFLSIGLGLYFERSPRSKLLGYALMGMALLCKQSFLLIVPVFLIVTGDWRKPRCGLVAAMPGVIYFIYLLFTGALPDAVLQLTVHNNEFVPRGIKVYFHHHSVLWGTILGYLTTALSFRHIKSVSIENILNAQRFLGAIVFFGVLFFFSIRLSQSNSTAWSVSFALFGIVLGATIYFMLKEKNDNDLVRIGILVLSTAWSVSFSIGYNTPALAAGPLAVLLIVYSYLVFQSIDRKSTLRNFPAYLLIVLFIVSVFNYGIARQKYIYEDQPAHELAYPLDNVFAGGRLLRTNQNTYRFLIDFREAIEQTKGRDFTIIPGLPAYWVKSSKKNPLPINWVLVWKEMSSKRALINRVLRDLDTHRGKIVVLLQKVKTDSLAVGYIPLPNNEISRYVRDHFTKIGETRFFELYQ